MHSEWFPLDYPESFYERIYKNNVISIGCFVELTLNDNSKREIIIGTAMTKVNMGNEELSEIYRAKDYNSGGLMSWFSSMFCRNYEGAYIMTIGIVDECRRMGLGTKLLDYTIKVLREYWTRCEVIYLHVVDYNETAIRFYERNGFVIH